MPSEYAMIEPAARPRPGPTPMPWSLAHCVKSWTIRKYAGMPLGMTIDSS